MEDKWKGINLTPMKKKRKKYKTRSTDFGRRKLRSKRKTVTKNVIFRDKNKTENNCNRRWKCLMLQVKH